MTDFVVGARFDIKENKIAPAAEATAEQLEKLKKTAAEADAAVAKAFEGQPTGWRKVEHGIASVARRTDEAAKPVSALVREYANAQRAAAQATDAADTLTKAQGKSATAIGAKTAALAGLVGGFGGAVAASLAHHGATLLLSAAQEVLFADVIAVRNALESLNERMATAEKLTDALAAATGRLAEQKRVEAQANIVLMESDITRAELAQRKIGQSIGLIPLTARMALGLGDGGEMAANRAFAEAREKVRLARLGIEAAEERAALRAGMTADDRRRPGARDGGTRAARVSDVEKDLLRQAEAAIKAKRALDEYGAATDDIVEKARAEFTGRADVIAQIELEAQLRKKYGVDFVEENRARIRAMAEERAAAQRLADQYRATTGFIESGFAHVGDAISTGLTLPLDHGADAMKNFENQAVSSIRAIIAELNRLAIVNPIINAISGNNRLPTAYGPGGLWDLIFGGSSGPSAGEREIVSLAGQRHAGGFVDAEGPVRVVPQQLFHSAKRAHAGLYLGPGEVPIVAKEGEAVFTPRQMDNAGALLSAAMARKNEAPIINIIEQRGAGAPPVEARQRMGAGGRIETDVIVREGGKKAINDGAWDSAMQSRYGITPRAAR